MVSSSAKKFIVFICVVLGIAATVGMTPVIQQKKLLKHMKSLYTTTDNESDKLEMMDDLTQGDKVIVKTEDAKKEILNVKLDDKHKGQVIPAESNEMEYDGKYSDSSLVEDERIEEILNSAPSL